MYDNGNLHVVFGASGSLGNAVVRELVGRGNRVRAVNRSGRADAPAGVELVKGDAPDPESTRATCEGAAVVYNCTNVPYSQWEDKMPALMAGIIEGAASAGASLVYCDNLYMYGPRCRDPSLKTCPTAPLPAKAAPEPESLKASCRPMKTAEFRPRLAERPTPMVRSGCTLSWAKECLNLC